MDDRKDSVVTCSLHKLFLTVGNQSVTDDNLTDTIQKAAQILEETKAYCEYIDGQMKNNV